MIKKKIINEILKEKKGISLEKFIDVCLFDKDDYYQNVMTLGKSGDFITAPEISQLFGEILGLYILNLWKEKYKKRINLIELGPGNGTLLIDVLRITKPLFDFHYFLDIHLIEKNFFLVTKQKQNLKINKFKNINFKWHDNISNIKQKPSIIIANEFFDCLPIRQFQKKNNEWHEKVINFNQVEDKFFYQNLSVHDDKLLKKLAMYKNEDIVELSEQREDYFRKICEYIVQSSGTIIIIDYGYYDFPGQFTLQSIFNHKYANLLDNVGKQDITSLVDFKKFIVIARDYNLKIDTYCNQNEFLLSNGLVERKNKVIQKCEAGQKKIIEIGYNRLIDKKQMGSIFKFLIVSSKNFGETVQ